MPKGPSDQEINEEVDKALDEISTLYQSISDEVQVEVESAIVKTMTEATKAAVLLKVVEIVTRGKKETDEILVRIIPATYKLGIQDTNGLLSASLANKKLTPAHTLVVNALLSDASRDFGIALDGVHKSAGQMLSAVFQDQLRQVILEGEIAGRSLPATARDLLIKLREQGFTTVIRSNGMKMNLKSYAEMLTRTHTIRAANEGTIQRAGQLGITVFEMSSHGGSCPICSPYEGKNFDVTGKKYPKPPDMPIHPNCRHKLFARPDL